MKTQKEQILSAKRAYIVPITKWNSNTGFRRFAVYLDDGGEYGLNPVWPSDSDKGSKFKDKLPCQVYSKRKSVPAYHFAMDGFQYSKEGEIRDFLKKINPDLVCFKTEFDGWTPSFA